MTLPKANLTPLPPERQHTTDLNAAKILKITSRSLRDTSGLPPIGASSRKADGFAPNP